jgi:hypothetical protein
VSTPRKDFWPVERVEAAKILRRTGLGADAPSFGAGGRLALQALLRRTGHEISLATIHAWTRPMQGQAYQWAIAFVAGDPSPPPGWVRSFGALGELRAVLRRAGYDVAVADLARWSRPLQGAAYLWARDFAAGREDLPPPPHVALNGIWKGRP